MLAYVQSFFDTINQTSAWGVYVFLFVSSVLQVVFPPYPGATILLVSGYAGSIGLFGGNIPIFLSFWIATVLSTIALYELGAWKGQVLLDKDIVRKYFSAEDQDKVCNWMSKYGMFVFFICKFVPAINAPGVIFCGALKFKRRFAYPGIFLAAVAHDLLFYSIGRAIGSNWDQINRFLSMYNKLAIVILIVAAIAFAVYRICVKVRKIETK